MKSKATQTTGEIIRQLRAEKELPLRKIAALLDIDTSFYSKIERNERKATKEQIHKLEEIFEVEKDFLMVPYLSENIYYELFDEDCASKVLKVAEEKIEYNNKSKRNIK
jgi:transcriptional regulator with XRE-family HTH domain